MIFLDISVFYHYYYYLFRTPVDCITELLELAIALKEELEVKYNQAVAEDVKKLAKIFDLEAALKYLSAYRRENSIVHCSSKEQRVAWETYGEAEFSVFWRYLCRLPQVEEKMDDSNLNLLPHDSILVWRRYKKVRRDLGKQIPVIRNFC